MELISQIEVLLPLELWWACADKLTENNLLLVCAPGKRKHLAIEMQLED